MSKKIDLSGRSVYITGGTRGIGWACAQAFAEAGASVALCGRSDEILIASRTETLKNKYGIEALGLCCDVTKQDEVKSAFKTVNKTFGKLDFFVNNAGVMDTSLLAFTTVDSVTNTMATNVTAAFLNMQMAAKLMARKKVGSIINVSSIVGRFGAEGQVAYSASKAAIIGMTSAAAKELAGQNIRVNAIAPGFINTDLLEEFDEQAKEKVIESIKLGRIGSAAEVADAVLFLASDMSSYITGQILGVDGGMLI